MPPPTQHAPDDNLDFLAYFHFAVAALSAMLSLVPALYLFVNYSLSHESVEPGVRAEAIQSLQWAPVAIACFALAVGFGVGTLLALEGRCLQLRKRWGFCRAASIVGCLFVPFGTLLGAATLGILTRPEVRQQFR